MPSFCSNCKAENLPDNTIFCPYCGFDMNKPKKCYSCGTIITIENAKFCVDCGANLLSNSKKTVSNKTKHELEELPVPEKGLTLEFYYSSLSDFDFALKEANKFESFKKYGSDTKAIYRVNVPMDKLTDILELESLLSPIKKKYVYVDAEKIQWDSFFKFRFSYKQKQSYRKPELYCFGYDFGYERRWSINPWGCLGARLEFGMQYWSTWGKWLNKKGDWQFDKERMRHELEKNLFDYRFCPALDFNFVEKVLAVFPDVINPERDKDWEFVERRYNGRENYNKLVRTVKRDWGIEKIELIGVRPKGTGKEALKNIMKKVADFDMTPLLKSKKK